MTLMSDLMTLRLHVDRLSATWIHEYAGAYNGAPPVKGVVVSVWPKPGECADPYYPPGDAKRVWKLLGQRIGEMAAMPVDTRAEYLTARETAVALCTAFNEAYGYWPLQWPMLWTLEAIPPHLK